jgi:sulfite reductase alpha subunit-like flavoprotein
VQDLVRRESPLVYRMLYELSGVVYICGCVFPSCYRGIEGIMLTLLHDRSSGKMPQAVREALIEVFQKEGAMQRQAAEAYLLSMEKEGRYKQETW